MDIRIITGIRHLSFMVSARLEEHGHPRAAVVRHKVETFELRYGRGITKTNVQELLVALWPLQPDPLFTAELPPDDIEITLGCPQGTDNFPLIIRADSATFGLDACELLTGCLDFSATEVRAGLVDEPTLRYGGAPPFVRQLLRFILQERGIKLREEAAFSPEDNNLLISLRDPQIENTSFRERVKVNIVTDHTRAGRELAGLLRIQGFRVGQFCGAVADDKLSRRFGIASEWFDKGFAPSELAELRSLLEGFMNENRVAIEHFPVQVLEEAGSGVDVVISLPLTACLEGRLRPYAGNSPRRYSVVIGTEDGMACPELETALLEVGFDQFSYESLDDDDFLRGFCVLADRESVSPEIYGLVREAATSAMKHLEVPNTFPLGLRRKSVRKGDVLGIAFPFQSAIDGSLLEKVNSPALFNLRLFCVDPENWEDLSATLKTWNFKSFDTRDDDNPVCRIRYGGAPVGLVEKVRNLVTECCGLEPSLSKCWSENDDDIYLEVPQRPANKVQDACLPTQDEAESQQLLFNAAACERISSRPFLQIDAERRCLYIGKLEIPILGANHLLVPGREGFAHFCLDSTTAATLHHLGLSFLLNEPCLLEGATSTSKTSSIHYFAALRGQPVLRINLNGQTDTGELIGRHVPDGTGWRWQDGALPMAMKDGLLLLLDEYNLSYPEIRERCNSATEDPPSLVISENDHVVIGPGGQPVHAEFRICATMNPAEYAGRQPLSLADRDRWRGYRFVSSPGEKEYAEMLMFLATGRQPDIIVDGVTYPGAQCVPPVPGFGNVSALPLLVKTLAQMHAAFERAAAGEGASTGLGRNRRDGFVVTRRSLLSLMRYLATVFLSGGNGGGSFEARLKEGLGRYYMARGATAEDREAIGYIFDAAGLGNRCWTL